MLLQGEIIAMSCIMSKEETTNCIYTLQLSNGANFSFVSEKQAFALGEKVNIQITAQ